MLWQYTIKVAITALVVVAVAELSKRNALWGAALAALPLTSLLAFVWLHLDGEPSQRIADLSVDIFWLVLPSLALFVLLPLLLRAGVGFWPSLGLSCIATAIVYSGSIALLAHLHR